MTTSLQSMRSFLLVALLALVVVVSYPMGAHAALSNAGRVTQYDRICSGTFVKSLTSTDGSFDGISTAQLPADYATPGNYCITRTSTISAANCDAGIETGTFALYSTASTNAKSAVPGCYNDSPPGPAAYNYSVLTYVTPSASLTSSPATIYPPSSTSSQLTWSSNGSSCTGTGFSTGGAPSGSVSVSPSTTTNYSVSCTVGSSNATASATVTVTQPLSSADVSCSVSPTTAALNQLVTWAATVTGGTAPYTYTWTGDNLIGKTGTSTQVSYTTAGVKSGGVSVTDSGAAPTSNFSAVQHPNTRCTGTLTSYSGSDITDAAPWDTATGHQYIWPYSIGNNPPDLQTNYATYCGEIHMTDQVTSIDTIRYTVKWYSGNGTRAAVPSDYAAPGTWSKEYFGTDTFSAGSSGSTGTTVTKQCSNTVTVNGAPTVPTFSAPGITCPGAVSVGQAASFTLSASDPDGDQIKYGADWDNNQSVDEWKPTSGYVASGVSQTFSHTWNTTGTYAIEALAQDSGGNQSPWASCSVNVVAAPVLNVSCSAAPISANINQSVTWTAVPSGGSGAYTYAWSGSESLSGSATSTVKAYTAAGTKTAAVTVTSGGQTIPNQPCTNSVTVTSAPPTLSASCSVSPSAAALNQSVTWTAVPAGGTSAYTYTWSGSENLTGSATTTAKSYTTTGTKTAAVTVTSGAQTVSNQACLNSLSVTSSICNNSVDENGNGLTDCADPICHSDFDVHNAASCVPGSTEPPGTRPVCSNGTDDNGNGLSDSQDPGCHTDGNPGNPGSYNPNGTSESSTQCSDGINNDNKHGTDCADPACHVDYDLAQACDPTINNESLPPATLNLSVVNGNMVRPQASATITWTTAFVKSGSCSVTGDNLPLPHDQWFGNAGQKTTSPLTNLTTYTLACLDLASSPVTATTSISVAPSSGEE